MEGNTPGRGSGVPGEETEGLKKLFYDAKRQRIG